MTTAFPTALDNPVNPGATDAMDASPDLYHDVQHANINDMMRAVQAKLGIDGSVVQTSHDWKLSLITGTDRAASAALLASTISGLGTMSAQNANGVAITGGSINGTAIGGSTPAAGAFTTLSASGAAAITGTLTLGSLTQGRIPFASTAGLVVDSASLTFDDTTKRLGVSGTAGQNRDVQGMTGTSRRWILRLGSSAAESGGDAGSDFALLARTDADGDAGTVLTITRAAGGAFAIARPVTMSSTLAVTGASTLTGTVTANNILAGSAGSLSARIHAYANDATTTVGADRGILIEQAGAGDAMLNFLLTSVNRWSVGIDNSDSDSFKVKNNADLGNGSGLELGTGGDYRIGSTSTTNGQRVRSYHRASVQSNYWKLTWNVASDFMAGRITISGTRNATSAMTGGVIAYGAFDVVFHRASDSLSSYLRVTGYQRHDDATRLCGLYFDSTNHTLTAYLYNPNTSSVSRGHITLAGAFTDPVESYDATPPAGAEVTYADATYINGPSSYNAATFTPSPQNGGSHLIHMRDNVASAWLLSQDGTNDYIKVATTNGSEAITLGSAALGTKLFILGGATVWGDTASRGYYDITSGFQISASTGNTAALTVFRHSAGGGTPRFIMGASRGAAGTATAVTASDLLMTLAAVGADGTDYTTVAGILSCEVGGTVSTGNVPGLWRFKTRNTSGVLADRLTIGASGDVAIKTGALAVEAGNLTVVGTATVTTTGFATIQHSDTGTSGLLLRTSATDATAKSARIKLAHHTNAEEPVTLLLGTSDGAANTLHIGGGSSAENALTAIHFRTGATHTTTSGSLRALVTSNGEFLVGSDTTARQYGDVTSRLQVHDASAAGSALSLFRHSAGANGPRLIMGSSRAAAGTPTILQTNDVMSQILFVGADGVDYQTIGAALNMVVDAAPAADVLPLAWRFYTMNSAGSFARRLNISSGGDVTIDTGGLTVSAGVLSARASTGHEAIVTAAATGTTPTVLSIVHDSSATPVAGFGTQLTFRAKSDPTSTRVQGIIQTQWVVPTDASRTGRVRFFASDAASDREGLRIETSGTAAMLGFFGGAAVVKPASVTAALATRTAGATYGATEQTMLQEAHDMARTLAAAIRSLSLVA